MLFKKFRPVTLNDFEHGEDCPCCQRNERRTFLKTAAIASIGLIMPQDWARAAASRERMLKMSNPHTGEKIRTVFWTPDYGYIQPSLEQINTFFRDFRQNTKANVDIDLLNILHYMQTNAGANRTMSLHSGYRSAATNNMLARRSKKVAKKSYHIQAQAADISIQGYSARQLRTIARNLGAGGVGIYKGSNFLHVDSGPVRTWYY